MRKKIGLSISYRRKKSLKTYTPPLLGGLLSLSIYETTAENFLIGTGISTIILFLATVVIDTQ